MTSINVFALIPVIIFGLAWVAAAAYEGASRRAKKNLSTQSLGSNLAQRLCLWAGWFLVLVEFQQSIVLLGFRILPSSPYFSYTGLIISLLGIGFAIWARIYLGSNWSDTIALKKGQTLVTRGPYSIVRHPIYSGITLAIVGGAISAGDFAGLVGIALAVAFSLMRVRKENALMIETFGEDYQEYSERVKGYVPGVW
jgi:protein-S-isoprenylcysteine O-methyltransferase Ste14